jgi:hypothetical protein
VATHFLFTLLQYYSPAPTQVRRLMLPDLVPVGRI